MKLWDLLLFYCVENVIIDLFSDVNDDRYY